MTCNSCGGRGSGGHADGCFRFNKVTVENAFEQKMAAPFDPEKVERTTWFWNNGQYKVDRPNIDRMVAVPAEDYDRLLAEFNKLKAIVDQVDDVLVVNWVGPRVDGDYKKALYDLVDFNIKIATDPAVNGGYELVKK